MASTLLGVVYSNDCPASLKRVTADNAYVWQCDGTADQVQINDAINSVMATGQTSSSKPTGGGGHVELVGFNFNLSAPIYMQSWVDLGGAAGRAATQLNAVSGFSGDGMITFGDGTNSPTYVELCTLHDLYIDGGNIGTGIPNIYLNSQTTQTPFTYSDPKHTLHDLWCINASGAGIQTVTSVRSTLYDRIHIGESTGWGIDGTGMTDCMINNVHLEGCGTAGTSGGVYVEGASTTWTGCRVYNSHGYGWQVANVRNNFNGCVGIDSSYHNWYITSGKVSLAGCVSDSAGLGSSSPYNYNGFHINSAVANLFMTGCQTYDRNGTPHQGYGVYLNGAPTYSLIQVSSYGNANGPYSGSVGTGSTLQVIGNT